MMAVEIDIVTGTHCAFIVFFWHPRHWLNQKSSKFLEEFKQFLKFAGRLLGKGAVKSLPKILRKLFFI
jgi:hypothetical protein